MPRAFPTYAIPSATTAGNSTSPPSARDQTSLNGQVIIAGKGAFRRAANVEGRGLRYAEPTEATAEALARDVAQLLDMEGATEFADAMAAFQQLFGEDSGAK